MNKVLQLLFALILMLPCLLTAQTVSTISSNVLEDGLALDSEGNLYVSHFYGGAVYKISTAGDVSPFVSGLGAANGLAFDSADNLYVSDWQGNKIYKFDINGDRLDSIAVSGNPSGMIKSFDSDDMIFTHYSANKISRLNGSDGTVTTISEDANLNGPVGLAYDENGNLFVGNYNNRVAYKVMADGTLTYIAQLPGSGSLPHLGFMTYNNGKLYGTVLSTNKIYSINPDGVDDYEVFAGTILGSADGPLSEATFNGPNGILFNETGDVLYISEFGSKNLRIITGILSSTTEKGKPNMSLSVSPNPIVKDILTVNATLTPGDAYQLGVYDASGKELVRFDESANDSSIVKTINIAQFSSGIYFVRLTIGNQSVAKKVIK